MNFSITQLEYVWAVYKNGHFGRAALECGVTQPTLSMQVQKFETDLGITVFDRSKKPILLTDKGRKILNQIQVVLFEAKKIKALIEFEASEGIQGELKVGVIPTVAPYVLPLLLPQLEKTMPALKLKIYELQTHRIIEGLQGDSIDVGILATPLNLAKIIEFPLFFEPFYVLCQVDHPVAKNKKIKYSSLKFEDIWLLEEGHCLRNQVLDVCSFKKSEFRSRNYQFESGSLETLKNLVESYGGYTLIPHLAKYHLGKLTRLIEFERPIPSREIGLVYQRAQYKHELIEALGEAIINSIPEEIRKLRRKDLEVIPVENKA